MKELIPTVASIVTDLFLLLLFPLIVAMDLLVWSVVYREFPDGSVKQQIKRVWEYRPNPFKGGPNA